MIPKSLSASALTVASLCLSRYQAEYIDYARTPSGIPALQGTSCHYALEHYVQAVYIDKTQQPSLKLLLDLYRIGYLITFDVSEVDQELFDEGVDMLERWFKRTDLSGVNVLQAETKENFPIKTSIGPIPFNFIYDRLDEIGPGEYRVTDYKTVRKALRHDDLNKKIQARVYGVAAQIKFPDATKIWVEFDMLRHDGPVGISYTKADNIATWKFLKDEVKRIIDTDEPKETLNPECHYCPRKAGCKELQKNILVGGIASLGGPQDMVDVRAQIGYQAKALKALMDEMDAIILAGAKEEDVLEFESESNRVAVTSRGTRGVDAERVERVIGIELMRKYGGASITMGNVDRLLKKTSTELTEEQKKQLRSLIYTKQGEPRIAVEPRGLFEE